MPLLTEADVAEAKAVKSELDTGRTISTSNSRLSPAAGPRTKRSVCSMRVATGVQLAIIFDKQVLMTPRLMSVIRDEITISGQFDEAQANEIARKINPQTPPRPSRRARGGRANRAGKGTFIASPANGDRFRTDRCPQGTCRNQ